MLKTPYLNPNITNTNTLQNFLLTSMYTWHMGSRWYTSDLHQ